MEDVNRTYGCTIIIVTHNAAIARMANRVLRPVSYTHLDVYKRQMQSYRAASNRRAAS